MKYIITECEVKVFVKDGANKQMKKMSLLGDGMEKVEPRVAIFDNHPEFENAIKGGTVSGVLEKKDSGIPIPEHPGKNYVNRVLQPEGWVSEAPPQAQNAPVAGLSPKDEARLKKLEDKVFGEEINPDDIPF